MRPERSWARARMLGRPRPSLATDLGALAGSIGPNRMAFIDLAGFVRQKSTEKVAKATVKATLARFCVYFREGFRCFSRSLRASESMCSAMVRTPVFADRCGTSEGSHGLRKCRKTTKCDDKSQRRCFPSETRGQISKFSIQEAAWQ